MAALRCWYTRNSTVLVVRLTQTNIVQAILKHAKCFAMLLKVISQHWTCTRCYDLISQEKGLIDQSMNFKE